MSFQHRIMLGILLFASVGSYAEPAAAIRQRVSYCSMANDDRAKPLPAELVGAATRLFGLRPDDPKWVRESTVYRCMGRAVWLCNHGANITCAKADTRRSLPGVAAYCRENPNEDYVPMAVTGHGTIYTWSCVGGKPLSKLSEKLDARGFIADQWKRLE